MVKNLIDNLEKELNKFIGKNVIINQGGFLESNYFIKKFKFFVEYEILNIIDEESENYIKINLNQIYKLEHNEDHTIFYLDNDTLLTLAFKR